MDTFDELILRLEEAEKFISGFEDDYTQDVTALLLRIRILLRKVKA